jgi:hypothetical protein
MSALKEATAKRLAKYFRMLGSNFDGEVSNALQAMKQLLAAEGLNFNDIGIVIENAVADGPLEIEAKKFTETQATEIYQKGKQDGRAEEANNRPPGDPTEYYDVAGNPQWHAIALYCQRHIQHAPSRHHEFINDMAGVTLSGHLSEKQEKYLLSMFYQLGRGARQ